MPDRLLTIAEVAELLKCSPRTVYRLVADGLLPARRVAHADRRILESDFWEFVRGRQQSIEPIAPPKALKHVRAQSTRCSTL